MNQITFSVPDKIDLNQKETLNFLAAKLYEAGKLTLGQAADLAGFSKVAFAEIIGDYNVALINYPTSEFRIDAKRI
jgi:predicted HTH domain antitoxin